MSELPHDWVWAALRDAALPSPDSFIDGDWIEAPYITNHGIRLIQTGNIERASFLDKAESHKYISLASFRLLNCKWVRAGDLLICRLADPIGRACEIPAEMDCAITSVDCTIVRIDSAKFDKRFVLHWLNSDTNLKAAADHAAGSTRSRISRSNLAKLPIPKPLMVDQTKIAKILDTIDTSICETEAIIAKLKSIKQGLLHDLLTRGIAANGELRPPKSEAPQLYKDSPLGWIPKEWVVAKLESLLTEIGQGWSPDCGSISAQVGQWGVLKTTAIAWVGYSGQENKVLPLTLKARPALEVKVGDILVTRAGPASRVGVISYVAETRSCLMISDKMYRLRTLPSEVPAYIALALSSQHVQAAIGRTLSGMAESQTNISQSIVKELEIFRPSPEEQITIVARVAAIDQKLVDEQLAFKKLVQLKTGLMDDLLTGRVRVIPLLDEEEAAHG